MEDFIEWKDRKKLIDLRNKLAPCYQNEDGSIFYVEPLFYAFFSSIKKLFPQYKDEFLKKMDEIVTKNKKVVFAGRDDYSLVEPGKGYIFLTAKDISNQIGLIIEDKSNPDSDWKD